MAAEFLCDVSCHESTEAICTCWCHGVFHGRTGAKALREFKAAFLIDYLPATLRSFNNVLRQMDLFDGTRIAAEWGERIKNGRPERRRVSTRRARKF